MEQGGFYIWNGETWSDMKRREKRKREKERSNFELKEKIGA